MSTDDSQPPPAEPVPEGEAAVLEAEPPHPDASPSAGKELLFGGLGLAAGLLVGVVAGILGTLTVESLASAVESAAGPLAPTSTPIEDAVGGCGGTQNEWIAIGDEGGSLTMQSEGEEAAGATFTAIFCVLDALDIPDSVVSRIEQTRALDGRQEAEWAEFSASWGYHPDNGLNIIVEFGDSTERNEK